MTFSDQIAAFNKLVGEWDELIELYARERRRARVIDKMIRAHNEVDGLRFLLLDDMAYGRPRNRGADLGKLWRYLAHLRGALALPPATDRRIRQRYVGDYRIHLSGDEPDLREKAEEALRIRHPGRGENFDESTQTWRAR
jgi:hypothetical protein